MGFLDATRLGLLRDALTGWDVEVVYYLRRLNSFWPSHWQELIKHGSDITFQEYIIETNRRARNTRTYPNQLEQLQNLARAFGQKNLFIFIYDNLRDQSVDVYDYFLRKMYAIAPGEKSKMNSMNASLPPVTTELIRCLNMFEAGRTGKQATLEVRQAYFQIRKSLEAAEPFQEFRRCFNKHSQSVGLEFDHPQIQLHERELVQQFMDRVANRGSDTSLFLSDVSDELDCGSRYWPYAAGQQAFVKGLLQELRPRAPSVLPNGVSA